jgi:hypothetical protein
MRINRRIFLKPIALAFVLAGTAQIFAQDSTSTQEGTAAQVRSVPNGERVTKMNYAAASCEVSK